VNYDKLFALEERLRVVEGNDWFVRAYAQRWRDKATYVQPPLIDTEMVILFANTFQSPYYEH
jgi:hypothetical protein